MDGFRFDLAAALARSHARRRHALPVPRGHRPGPGAAPGEADRRALGRGLRRLPGGRLPAAVDGVERPLPRRRTGLLARRPAGRTRPRATGCPARATCTPGAAAARTPRSTSSPRTTASPCATWSATSASTTRPTARATATAPTTTGPGTAAPRARPTTRRVTRAAAPPAAQPADHAAAVDRACRCWSRATRWAAPRAATTTPTARTTRSAGSTGRCWRTPAGGRCSTSTARLIALRHAPSGAAPPGVLLRAAALGRTGCGTWPGSPPRGAEMTERDWYAPGGDAGHVPVRARHPAARDARGAPVVDDSFLRCCTPAPEPRPSACRDRRGPAATSWWWTPRGRTRRRRRARGTRRAATVTVPARSVLLLRVVPG